MLTIVNRVVNITPLVKSFTKCVCVSFSRKLPFKINVPLINSTNMKCLAVFDFDHTILDDNSDTAIMSLAGREEIPKEIKTIHYSEGWTAFMQAVFHYLYDKGVKSDEILNLIRDLPPVPGMLNLLGKLSKQPNFDMIVISDSNSSFIHAWFEKHGLENCFAKIFTNPAEVVDDGFKITPYHYQDFCKLSTKNMCKGQILEDFISEQKKKNISYDHVVYIGDGVNDFCPVLRLRKSDLICARKGYKLSELLTKVKQGTSLDNSGKPHIITAEIHRWDTGQDILEKIEQLN